MNNQATGTTFSAEGYFLGIAQRIVAARSNTRINLPGKGTIAIFPERGEYHANISDMAGFFQTPATDFEISQLPEAAQYAPDQGKNLQELLWQAAFHASQGRLLDGCSKYDVVQFRRWPNLTRLPTTANTARICALLTRHPTTIMLVHRQLGIEKEEVFQIYSAAHSAGLSNMVNRLPVGSEADTAHAQAEPVAQPSMLRSLFAKIAGL